MDIQLLIQTFPEAWRLIVDLFFGQEWLLITSVILFLTFSIDLIQRGVLGRFQVLFERSQQSILAAAFHAAIMPLSFYIWLTGVVLVITTIMFQFEFLLSIIAYINAFKSTISLIALAWFAIGFTRLIEAHLKQLEKKPDSKWDAVTIEAFAKILKLTIFVVTGLIVLSIFGVDLTGLIAFGGVGGIAVGFAAKDILGNIFGGLMLYLDKPFQVGDWVRSPDRNIEGVVEYIGWRMTVIRTFDKRPLYVPNGTFASISIENPSRMLNRRIKQSIGIRYCDLSKAQVIVDNIQSMLRGHPEIDQNQTLIVNVNAFSASSVDILIYTFTKTTDWVTYHQIKQDVMLQMSNIISAEGAEIAFPTKTLHIATDEADPLSHSI